MEKKSSLLLNYIKQGLKIFLAIFIFFLLLKIIFNVSVKNVVFFFGEKLDTDAYNHTNVLIMGIGGGTHDGADLTDTMLIASIDENNKITSLFSLPRDIFVKVKNIGNTLGGEKVNSVYAYSKAYYKDSEKALEITKNAVEEMMGIPIHYYVKIDFSGFEKVINAIGGVDVYVDTTLDDPFYPKGETVGYELLHVDAGWHHMDGTLALKYARSRQTTSVFDRDKRQRQIINAIKDKILNKRETFDESKIEDIFLSLKNNIETNLTTREIITLVKIGTEMGKDQVIKSYEFSDDPSLCGGWLVPGDKASYDGSYVLIPAGNKYTHMQRTVDFVLNNANLTHKDYRIQILNGTSMPAATKLKSLFNRYCLNVVRFGNANTNTVKKTTYYVKDTVDKDFIDLLKDMIPGQVSNVIPYEYTQPPYQSNADILIEIGSNYFENPIKDPYDEYAALLQQRERAAAQKEEQDNKASKNTTNTKPASIKN